MTGTGKDKPRTHCELCGLGGASLPSPTAHLGGGCVIMPASSFCLEKPQSSRIGKAPHSHPHCPRPPLVSRSLACTSSAPRGSLRWPLRTAGHPHRHLLPNTPSPPLGLHPRLPRAWPVPRACCSSKPPRPPPTPSSL